MHTTATAAGPRTARTEPWRRFAELTLQLAWRDVRVRYKQSLLGVAWAVLLPLTMMLVFTFVFTRAIDASAVASVRMPYALYAFTGLVPWTFFASSLQACTNSLVANRSLVTKVYFPREAFPLSCILAAFVDFLVAMGVLAGLMVYFHLQDRWALRPGAPWSMLPAVVAVQTALTAGAGMFLAAANLFYRDVRQVFGVAIQLALFVSGVIVPLPRDGSLTAVLLRLNPMVPILEAYRDVLVHGRWPPAGDFGYAAAVSMLVLAAGWATFRRWAHRFAESI